MKKTKTLSIIFLSWLTLNGTLNSANNAPCSDSKFNDNIQLIVGLTADDITKYLNDEGLTVDSTPVRDDDEHWSCYTSKGTDNYFTIVKTDGGTNIIIHEDVHL